MSYFVFSDHDRLRFGNFLDNLRLNSKRSAKLCSAIGTSICCNFYLTIRCSIRSRYAFMSDLLAGLFPCCHYPSCDCGHVLGLAEYVHSHIGLVGLQAH